MAQEAAASKKPRYRFKNGIKSIQHPGLGHLTSEQIEGERGDLFAASLKKHDAKNKTDFFAQLVEEVK